MSNSLPTKGSAVTFTTIGTPHEVVTVKSFKIPELGPEDVLVKVLAGTINPSDITQINGIYAIKPVPNKDFPDVPTYVGGNEGILEVVEVGKDVPGLKAGDWVMPAGSSFGTWRSHAVLNYKGVTGALPNIGVDPVYLATSNINPVSAMQMLTRYADLKPGDWFIQNAGNSAVGRAAIQIAKLRGIKSISVVRSRDNLSELIAELKALGADEVITEEQSSDREFDKTIQGWVDGKLKLALNCVGGESGNNLMRHLSFKGAFVVYGAMTRDAMSIDIGHMIFKNITIHGYWLAVTAKEDPAGHVKDLGEVFRMIGAGELAKVPTHEVKLKLSNTDEENTKIARDTLASYANGFTNNKLVFVFE